MYGAKYEVDEHTDIRRGCYEEKWIADEERLKNFLIFWDGKNKE